MARFFLPVVAARPETPAAVAQTATPAEIGHHPAPALLAARPETPAAVAQLPAFTHTWQSPYDALTTRFTALGKDFLLAAAPARLGGK